MPVERAHESPFAPLGYSRHTVDTRTQARTKQVTRHAASWTRRMGKGSGRGAGTSTPRQQSVGGHAATVGAYGADPSTHHCLELFGVPTEAATLPDDERLKLVRCADHVFALCLSIALRASFRSVAHLVGRSCYARNMRACVVECRASVRAAFVSPAHPSLCVHLFFRSLIKSSAPGGFAKDSLTHGSSMAWHEEVCD